VGGTCSPNGGKEECVSIIGGKAEEKRPLGRPRHRWAEIGWGSVDWIGLAQDRHKCRALVNSVLNLRVP
jgi:hypothetical protein